MADTEKLLEEIREAYDYCVAEWADIREEGRKDMVCAADGPWSDDERKERIADKRPCLALDELAQYTNEAVNNVRQNKRAVKVIPEGNGANDVTAQNRAGMIRQIEYDSNAQAAYIGGFESMLMRGYGVWKIKTCYDGPKTFDQKFKICAIANPDTVLLDPDAKEPDWSDMGYAFEIDSYSEKKFKKSFPGAEIQDFSGEHVEAAPAWVGAKNVKVGSYWKRDMHQRRLLLLDMGGQGGPVEHYLDELPKGSKVQDSSVIIRLNGETHKVPLVNHRKTEDPIVTQYITNGIEILETNPTKWDEVPLIPVFAKEMFVDNGAGAKRRLISMIRMARDPYMLYCYYRTNEAEVAGMSPKIIYLGYEGQFATNTPWERINKTNMPYAEVKARTAATGGETLPLPTRQPYDPPIQSLEMGAESARRAIQSAMGVSGMLSGNRSQNQDAKSGVALKELDSQTSQSNFHFVDNYDRAMERTGRLLERGLRWCYDTERDVTMRTPDDEHESLHINGPQIDPKTGQPAVDAQGQPLPDFNTADGDHKTTISVGPSQQSQREAGDDFAQSLMGAKDIPPKVRSLAVKLLNLGPIGDEISKAFDPEPDPTDPGQQAQQMQGLQAELQKTQAFAQSLHEQLTSKQPELAVKLEIAKMQEETKRVIGLATINSAEAQTKFEQELGIIHKKVDQMHEIAMQNNAQNHAAGMAAAGHAADAGAQASDLAAKANTQATALNADSRAQDSAQAHDAAQATQSQGAAADSQQSAQDAAAEAAAQPKAA